MNAHRVLLTTDGKGKEAKRKALHRLLVAQAEETLQLARLDTHRLRVTQTQLHDTLRSMGRQWPDKGVQ